MLDNHFHSHQLLVHFYLFRIMGLNFVLDLEDYDFLEIICICLLSGYPFMPCLVELVIRGLLALCLFLDCFLSFLQKYQNVEMILFKSYCLDEDCKLQLNLFLNFLLKIIEALLLIYFIYKEYVMIFHQLKN